jgi:membrane protease YdiL (CAAX protease family)
VSSRAPLPPQGGVAPFIALSFAITWIAMAPAILAWRGLAAVPPGLVVLGAVVGSCGPTLAAIVVVALRREGVRSLLAAAGTVSWRRILLWTCVALVVPVLLHLVGGAVFVLLGVPAHEALAFGLPSTAEHVGILIVAPLGEELGWRGLAQRRLGLRWGPLQASLVVGAAWAAWHAPMFVARPAPALELVMGAVLILAGSVVFAALFHESGGSVAVAIALHAGVHVDNVSRVGGPALVATCFAFLAAAIACAWRWSRLRVTPS